MTNLRVLQYLTNGTQFTTGNDSSTTSLGQRLKLVEVATIDDDGASLTLLKGTIWPGIAIYCICTVNHNYYTCTHTAVIIICSSI